LFYQKTVPEYFGAV